VWSSLPNPTKQSTNQRLRTLGRFAEERGDLERAVAWYSKIVGDLEATEALGRLAEAGSSSALGELRRAADTGDPEATEALRRLEAYRGKSTGEGFDPSG
jgi:hypothetical protein